MQDDNNKRPENIGCVLYLIDRFNSDRQNEEPPESVIPEADLFHKRRRGFRFIREELRQPIIIDSVYLRLATKNASAEEIIATANKHFDSQNEQLLKESTGGIDALKQNEKHLSRRQANLEKLIEESSSIRTLYSGTDLVTPSNSAKSFFFISSCVVVGLSAIEWGNQASLVQMSGEEAFLGSGGFLKALLVTPVLIIFTVLLKNWLPDLGKKDQKAVQNIFVSVLLVLAVIYFFAFASYYGFSINETSLEMPPDIYKKIMIFTQLAIAPFAIALIFNKFGKQANHYKEEEVFHSKEFLALDEELSSVVARRKDTEQMIKHLEGFWALYLAEKARYAEEFYGEYVEFQVTYLSVTNTAIAGLRKNRDKDSKKPMLKVVKGDKK